LWYRKNDGTLKGWDIWQTARAGMCPSQKDVDRQSPQTCPGEALTGEPSVCTNVYREATVIRILTKNMGLKLSCT
jgi:hypothetical protein